ncbi:MAG: PQQ-binding-like beta-propeller repeat protein [Verrucomicrobiales bacterium]
MEGTGGRRHAAGIRNLSGHLVGWRCGLAGGIGRPGNSSPVVVGNRLFLTEAREKGHERSLVCFDTATGKERWRQTVKYGKDEITHATNPWCSASPLVHEGMVYAWHGSAGLHAYDLDGRAGWQADLGEFAHIWGPNAASPVVWGI